MGPALPHNNRHFRYHFPYHHLLPLLWNTLLIVLLVVSMSLKTHGVGSAEVPTDLQVVKVALLCDDLSVQECGSSVDAMAESVESGRQQEVLPWRLALNVSVVPVEGKSPEALRNVMHVLQFNGSGAADVIPDVLVAVGSYRVVQLATIVSQALGRPLIGYVSDGQAAFNKVRCFSFSYFLVLSFLETKKCLQTMP